MLTRGMRVRSYLVRWLARRLGVPIDVHGSFFNREKRSSTHPRVLARQSRPPTCRFNPNRIQLAPLRARSKIAPAHGFPTANARHSFLWQMQPKGHVRLLSSSARGPAAVAVRGFPSAHACPGGERAGGAYDVDAEDELPTVVHRAAGYGAKKDAADLSVGHPDSHGIPVRAFAGVCHGLDPPTAVVRKSRLTGGAE